jgi:hypothetical protein
LIDELQLDVGEDAPMSMAAHIPVVRLQSNIRILTCTFAVFNSCLWRKQHRRTTSQRSKRELSCIFGEGKQVRYPVLGSNCSTISSSGYPSDRPKERWLLEIPKTIRFALLRCMHKLILSRKLLSFPLMALSSLWQAPIQYLSIVWADSSLCIIFLASSTFLPLP